MQKLKIGLIKEGKVPPDSRVPLTPAICRQLLDQYGDRLEIYVAPSSNRCYTDEEYQALNIPMKADLSDCDVLMGVKEVPKVELIRDKQYFFFSHTIKKQPYNRELLQKILMLDIKMTDYECLTWANGRRIIGFGRFAGIVGAHNGFWTYGRKLQLFELKAAHECKDYAEMVEQYKAIQLPPIKIVITGNGRVAQGAKEMVDKVGIKEVTVEDYLHQTFEEPVYVHLPNDLLYQHKERQDFDKPEFYQFPAQYESTFDRFIPLTDLMINGIYWAPAAPIFFSLEDLQKPDFHIKVLADVTCDINGSVPTPKATVIGDPTMAVDLQTGEEVAPFQAEGSLDIMSVDNLPNELPRDASQMFGEVLATYIIPELLKQDSEIIENATIADCGLLTERFRYLEDYVGMMC